jgi:hypothetical protein
MIPQQLRGFDCPEGGQCADGRCVKGRHCVLGQKERADAARRVAERENRPDPDIEKDIAEALRAIVIKREISN